MRSLALCLCLVWLPAAAGSPGHPVTMWLAEGTTNRIYLLGSVHLLRRQDHPLPDIIDDAYDDAETLYMEIDMDDVDPVAMRTTATRLGMLGEDDTLREVMGERLYREAVLAAEALDIPLAMLERTEPWYAAITIEQLALTRLGFDPAYGIEMHMLKKASRDGKEIFGFESIEEQLGMLDGLPMQAQRELLLQALKEGAEMQAVMDELIEAWRRGDIDYMEDNLLIDIAEHAELYETIVAKRNRNWVDTIDTLLDDSDDYLIIVGTLHLVGADGVPRLLERRGVPVRQMHESASRQQRSRDDP